MLGEKLRSGLVDTFLDQERRHAWRVREQELGHHRPEGVPGNQERRACEERAKVQKAVFFRKNGAGFSQKGAPSRVGGCREVRRHEQEQRGAHHAAGRGGGYSMGEEGVSSGDDDVDIGIRPDPTVS